MALQDDIMEACEDSNGEVNFYNNYSGRGMYGRPCIGITGKLEDCHMLIASVIKELGWRVSRVSKESMDPDYSATDKDLVETMEQYELTVDKLLSYSMDNFGKQFIVYWPNLEPIVPEENLDINLQDSDLREGDPNDPNR